MESSEKKSCCCCCSAEKTSEEKPVVFPKRGENFIATPCGNVSVVPTTLTFQDQLGAWKVRWGIGRMRFRVEPGLYAVGNPTADSPVLVTANYKMSFDILRSSLTKISAWILVLDTRGVNVWCAAGKKTFGADELVRRLEQASLRNVVSHRTVIVPQLGAVGVCAREVAQHSDFQVVFGPVRAHDLPPFIEAKMQATPAMRRVNFSLRERAVLVPIEIVSQLKYVLLAAIVFYLLCGLPTALCFAVLSLLGVALGPIWLPYLPVRSFWLKGAFLGGMLSLIPVGIFLVKSTLIGNGITVAALSCVLTAFVSYALMNFTGCTTFTSFSGVKHEMRRGIPFQLISGFLGIVLLIVGVFF